MDGFQLPSKKFLGATPAANAAAKTDTPETPAAPSPAPTTPSKAKTGPLSLPQPSAQKPTEGLYKDALPWETKAPAKPVAQPPAAGAAPANPFAAALRAEAGRSPTSLPGQEGPGVRRPVSTQSFDSMPAPARRTPTGGLNSASVLASKHKDVADAIARHQLTPDEICQVTGKGTCVAATVQKTLARQNPQLYATLVGDLAVMGQARLPNGKELRISAANRNWIDAQGLTGSAKVNALLQAALMELGDPGQGYLLAIDGFSASPGKKPGLSLDQARRLIEALLTTPLLDPRELKVKWDGHYRAEGLEPPADPFETQPSPALARKLLEGAEAGAFAVVRARDNNGELLRDADGRPLVEGLEEDEQEQNKRPRKKSHMVQIIAMDEEAGTVTFIDGLGAQRTMSNTTFARIMLMSNKYSDLEGIGSPDGAAL